jgi:hypothetical protein
MLWYLILLAVIVVLLILGGSVLFVRKYQHAEDAGKAWAMKFLVVRAWEHHCKHSLDQRRCDKAKLQRGA